MKTLASFIVAVRKDGRIFEGSIEKVQSTPRGTMVVVQSWKEDGYFDNEKQWNPGMSPVYKTVYLEECRSWSDSDYPSEL